MMNASKKIVLGILTFLPFLLIVLVINEIFAMIPALEATNQYNDFEILNLLGSVIIYSIVISLLVMAMMIYYIVDAFRTPHLRNKRDLQILWTVLLILFAIPASQIYYFIYVVNDPKEEDYAPVITDRTN